MPAQYRSQTPHSVVRRARELRQEMTPVETLLWNMLRRRQFNGRKFRRQAAIGPFIADFYCAETRLVVEIDGQIHGEQQEEDAIREQVLIEHSYHVIRFTNQQVLEQTEAVLSIIEQTCQEIERRATP